MHIQKYSWKIWSIGDRSWTVEVEIKRGQSYGAEFWLCLYLTCPGTKKGILRNVDERGLEPPQSCVAEIIAPQGCSHWLSQVCWECNRDISGSCALILCNVTTRAGWFVTGVHCDKSKSECSKEKGKKLKRWLVDNGWVDERKHENGMKREAGEPLSLIYVVCCT